MIDVTSRDAIKLQLLLAAALKGINLNACDCFHAAPDNSTKCYECGEEQEDHS
jgi:hypothetical protein